jgi:hypothetical protein
MNGLLEYWNVGNLGNGSVTSSFHDSIVPIFQSSLLPTTPQSPVKLDYGGQLRAARARQQQLLIEKLLVRD